MRRAKARGSFCLAGGQKTPMAEAAARAGPPKPGGCVGGFSGSQNRYGKQWTGLGLEIRWTQSTGKWRHIPSRGLRSWKGGDGP